MAYDISTANPMSYWRLGDRGAGTTCNDIGNSPSTLTYYTASSSAPSLLTTDSNPAVQSSGGVATGSANPSLLSSNSSASVEAWVRLGTASGRQYIWQMKDAKYDRYLYWTGTAFVFGITNGTTTNEVSATFDAKAGTVYYVVGTCDGSNSRTATLSVNGTTLVTQSVTQGWWVDGTNATIYLGRDSAGLYPWSGVLDEVAMEGYALTATDIQSHYAKGAAIKVTADSAWTVPATWRDGTPSGTIRLDGQPWAVSASWRNGLAPGETAATGSPGGYALGAYGISPYGGSSGGPAGPIKVTGSAWTSPAAWQDGAVKVQLINVAGQAWASAATWLDGTIPGPITISGAPWAAPSTWRDGTLSAVVITNGTWTSRATWLDGTAAEIMVIGGDAWAAPAVWVDGENVLVTSRTYDNDGYNYDGTADADYSPPVAPTPSHLTRIDVRRVHQSLPAPTLVDGRPT